MVGVINAASLDQEVVALGVAGKELYCAFNHLQDGRLVVFVALGPAVVVIAQVARRKQAQNLSLAGERNK